MNSTATNVGGWPASEARTYINSTILNALPSDLQNVITDTKVISGHGSTTGETNFTSTDKLYLLSTKEIWEAARNDTVDTETKQLDYYKNIGVTATNSSGIVKQYNGTNSFWKLRTANSGNTNHFILISKIAASTSTNANYAHGISPAFRIA